MASNTSHDDAINQFVNLTGTSVDEATEYLENFNYEVEQAAQAYFEDQDDEPARPGQAADPTYTGPRTLDGRPAPEPSSQSSASQSAPRRQPPPQRGGPVTLNDLNAQSEDDHGHDHEGGRGPRDLFAGGEKSGLAVQDPEQDSRGLVQDILAKARAAAQSGMPAAPAGPSQPAPNRFRGAGQTLGGEGVESRTIPDPQGAPIPRHAPGRAAPAGGQQSVVERNLHIWEDGFSIDDGPLYRHNDPRNRDMLRMISAGRMPQELMRAGPDEMIDVKLNRHDEPWHQLPRIYRPFGGEGRRLGSPVPGDPSAASLAATAAASTTTAATTTAGPSSSSQTSSAPVTTGLDESQPVITIRIQMPDGQRVPARFNTTQTVGDVYEFVTSSNPATRARNWVLATTFPNQEHIDRATVLGEMNEFKRGGTAVVKWI